MQIPRKLRSILLGIVLVAVVVAAGYLVWRATGLAAQRQLMALFPEEEGFTWIYNGFAEYGHTMTLTGIQREGITGRTVLEITGEVHDPSGGASKRDFSLALEYVFSGRAVKERVIRGDLFPHRLNPLEILRYPLRKGKSWTQKAGGRTIRATVLEDGVDPEDDRRFFRIRYTTTMQGLKNNKYIETRLFKEGLGVVRFENTILKDVDFNYFLFRAGKPPVDVPQSQL